MPRAAERRRARRRIAAAVGALLVGAAAGPAVAQRPPVIAVSPAGPVRTITEAVRLARPGARIVVGPGVYREPTILVDRPVEIVGDDFPVLDGAGERQIMTVTANGVVVRGLRFRDVGASYVEDRAAIKVVDATDCVIEGNRFEETFFAVYLAQVTRCRVAGNTITGTGRSESNTGNGIHLWTSREVTITGNEVHGHRDGIYLEFSRASEVRDNVSEGNLRYGLHFMYTDSCRYDRNVFANNSAGVAVMYSKVVAMDGNRFERNWGPSRYGLLLKEIADARITGNTFAGNSTALLVDGTDRMVVDGNDFLANGWAIRLRASAQDSRFTANNFIGNSFDVTTNSRQSYSTFAGNHWDAYRGYDLDRDGVGDVPFRPVRLFSLLVERYPATLALLRSLLVDLLDAAERVIPSLTPEELMDASPAMRRLS
ncbi:MAG TPA: nitrous oxide reductase family maturation protein NosD [Gemmatimonadaceae bacterium]|nr:nitrous oxide reductase family maturation protein NosD [Gemmatimonadaceae bacterium]